MSTPFEPIDLEMLSIEEPWVLTPVQRLFTSKPARPNLAIAAVDPPQEISVDLAGRGLLLADRNSDHEATIGAAGQIISRVPSLAGVVLRCVERLVVLQAPDDCHDVSHSEPRWPGIIFVSVPPAGPVGELRLAEGIVHEAMHLNLTRLEEERSLVQGSMPLYSPWKREARAPSGVLHGLYVFCCLHSFFRALHRVGPLSSAQRVYLDSRLRDIAAEVRLVDRPAFEAQLTNTGLDLCGVLYKSLVKGNSTIHFH